MARKSLKNVLKLIDTVTQELPPEQEFLNDLKRSIELTENKKACKPSQTYKPSSMQCIRNMYYQVTGAEINSANASYILTGICNSGSDIHVRIQTAVSQMKDNGIDCEYVNVAEFVKTRGLKNIQIVSQQGMETKLYHTTLNISFLCDGIIRYKGHYYILELKSESANKFWQRKGVDEKHYDQATAYSMALELDDVIFVYISRDTLDMKAYRFGVTDTMRWALIAKIEECNNYVEKQTVPPKPITISKNICQYCSYTEICGKDG